MTTADIFPDSRAKTTRGLVIDSTGTKWVPVFCANCGKEGGLVTESCTFAFWICNPCEKKHGHLTGMMRVPDAEFYENLRDEQIERAGRPMTQQELAKVLAEDPSSSLALLLKDAK